jgi:virulence-associated protein VagC
MELAQVTEDEFGQVVTFPESFRIQGEEVIVTSVDGIVILLPTDKRWEHFRKALEAANE